MAQALGGSHPLVSFFLFFSFLYRPPQTKGGTKQKNKIKIILDTQKKKYRSSPRPSRLQQPSCCAHSEAALHSFIHSFIPSFPSFTSFPRSKPHLFLIFRQSRIGNSLAPNSTVSAPFRSSFLPSRSPSGRWHQQSILPTNAVFVINQSTEARTRRGKMLGHRKQFK